MSRWSTTTEPDPGQFEQDTEREDEAIRDQRWTEFEAWLATTNPKTVLSYVYGGMEGHLTDPYYVATGMAKRLLAFAETEHWSGVLLALVRVMRKRGE